MNQLRSLFSVFALLGLLAWAVPGRAESPAEDNKRLFDRTVDQLNFRTMETVYDKSFTRRKFPLSLRTAKARRAFTDFANRDDLKTLFQNYNGVSERFKARFGSGRQDLREFEKQLNSILIDRNFEFFIRVLPRDERVMLIRALQRDIKQGTAQFNASEDPAPEELAADGAAVPPADVDAEAPLTSPREELAPTPEEEAEAALTSTADTAAPAPTPVSAGAGSSFGALNYLTLAVALAALALVARLQFQTIPELRRRLEALQPDVLEDDEEQDAEPTDPEAGTPPSYPTAAPTSYLTRPSRGLPEDRYEDD